jgi:DNA helicase IV
MDTNYRNAREIFDYAAKVVRTEVPDADIPAAVRETGVLPRELVSSPAELAGDLSAAVEDLLAEVEGSIAVVVPGRWSGLAAPHGGHPSGRVTVVDPLSTKGLEYDATVVVDPTEISRESPGGVRVLYVALTRAAHRMAVLAVG